ncbi:ParB N-terminal domain-containing protein [Lancefieldella parvula]|uniref:ParB N-terminal domain-containing protein n=1 Tax=Lancefieldella parvula TaxID=1382 RepID=UPI0035D00728
MDINKIIPYARNARHNKKAIPAVADSIRQFGLRGQIVLESRENPVIVTGHTRVEACNRSAGKRYPTRTSPIATA